MVEVSWASCHAHGGPFAHYIWYTKDKSLDDHAAAIWALSLVLILVQIPIAGTLYALATLSSRRDALLYQRKRAEKTSNLIDEQDFERNKLEVMHAKHARVLAFSVSTDSSNSSSSNDRVVDLAKLEEKKSRILAKKQLEIEEQSKVVEDVRRRLEALPDKESRTEKFVARLRTGPPEKVRKNRTIFTVSIVALVLLTLPPVVFAPFAIQAHLHCDEYTPPKANATSGLWLAYVLCNGVPTAIAYAQLGRAALHWRKPEPFVMEEDEPEYEDTGLSQREHRAMETWKMRTRSQVQSVGSSSVSPDTPTASGLPRVD